MSQRFVYRLSRRGIEVTSEVVCAAHYLEFSQAGRDMAPLTERERHYEQKITPYDGPRECATCAEEAERAQNAGEAQDEMRRSL